MVTKKYNIMFIGHMCYDEIVPFKGETFYEQFSNKSIVGRTGRGDTTFAAYLFWRLNHEVAESLKFSAALVSIKMESPGPFKATSEDVLERIKRYH